MFIFFGGIVSLSFVLDVYWLTQERFVTFENFLVRGRYLPLDHHTGGLECPKIVFPSPVGSRSSLLGWWNTYSQCCEQSILWIVWSRRSRECPGSLPNDKICLINTKCMSHVKLYIIDIIDAYLLYHQHTRLNGISWIVSFISNIQFGEVSMHCEFKTFPSLMYATK